jgi:hypothetical protein
MDVTPTAETSHGVLDEHTLVIDTKTYGLRLFWGDEPRAESRDYRGRWTPCLPDERVILPAADAGVVQSISDAARARYEAFQSFRKQVPEDLALKVEPYESYQWNFLVFLHSSPKGRELAESNPVLAYALANNHELRAKPDRTALPLAMFHCQHKQKDILVWLGFDKSDPLVRIFKKIDPAAAAPYRLLRLRAALHRSPSLLKTLGHLEVINAQVLDMVLIENLTNLATPALLQKLSILGRGEEDGVASRLSHALSLNEAMVPPEPVRPFRSIAKITEFVERVDRLYLEYQRRLEAERQARLEAEEAEEAARRELTMRYAEYKRQLEAGNYIWPPSPIKGNEHIKPILSRGALIREGIEQQNCVAIFWQHIIEGYVFIYTVNSVAGRATLSLRRVHGDSWRISELKGKNNTAVSARLKMEIDQWLYEYEIMRSYTS